MDKKIYILLILFSIVTLLFSFCETEIEDIVIEETPVPSEPEENKYDTYLKVNLNENYYYTSNNDEELIVNKNTEVAKKLSEIFKFDELNEIMENQLNNKYPNFITENIKENDVEITTTEEYFLLNYIKTPYNFEISIKLKCDIEEEFELKCSNDHSLKINESNLDINKKSVALTFDDGPNKYTSEILEVLKKYNVNATFFVLGMQMEYYPHITKDAFESGFEIGNHTYSHKYLTKINEETRNEEINKTNEIYNKITGSNLNLLRPTYGSYNENLLKNLDYTFVNWSIDSQDWRYKDPNKTINQIMKDVEDGDIILLHDIQKTTAEAIEPLVIKLLEEGYQITSVSELAKLKEVELETNKLYRKFETEETE